MYIGSVHFNEHFLRIVQQALGLYLSEDRILRMNIRWTNDKDFKWMVIVGILAYKDSNQKNYWRKICLK